MVFRHLMGSIESGPIIVAVVLLWMLSWAGEAIFNWVNRQAKLADSDLLLVWVALFVVGLILLRHFAHRSRRDVRTRVSQSAFAPPAKALALFLSPPGRADQAIIASGELCGNLRDAAIRARLTGPWRMALEAIAYHADELELILVLPSANVQLPSGTAKPGTVNDIDDFKRMLGQLSGSKVRVKSLADADPAFAAGIDFEDAIQVSEATAAALQYLSASEDCQYAKKFVMLDITGGNKIASAVAAILSLTDDRVFQYVSTADFRVKVYDISHHW